MQLWDLHFGSFIVIIIPIYFLGLGNCESLSLAASNLTCGQLTPNYLEDFDFQSGSKLNIPWAAAIIRVEERLETFVGAGVLVSPSIVMTAASYLSINQVLRIYPFETYFVTVGGNKFNAGGKKVQITHISLHPKFEKGFWTSVKNDQILLHLERDVVSSSSIQPICLPQNVASIQANIGTNDSLIMTGWGSYSEQLFLKMDLRSPEDCQDRWKSAGLRDPDRGTVTNDNIKVPYVDRYCAKTSTDNRNSNCVTKQKDVATMKQLNGSYFLVGQLNHYFSHNQSRICYPGSGYFYFLTLSDETLIWIRNTTQCASDKFTCGDGHCIPLSKLCSRFPDCADGSDENPEFCRDIYKCKLGERFCDGDRCISTSKLRLGLETCDIQELGAIRNNSSIGNWPWWLSTAAGFLGLGVVIAITVIRRLRKNPEMQKEEAHSSNGDHESEVTPVVPSNLYQLPTLVNSKWKSNPNLICLGLVGMGSYGTVYRAKDLSDIHNPGRYVIKCVEIPRILNHLQSMGISTILSTLLNEIDILSRLNFDHVVRYFGCWAEADDCSQLQLSRERLQTYLRELSQQKSLSSAAVTLCPMSCLFIKMEYCDLSLGQWLATERKEAVVAMVIEEIAKGLQYVHEKGFIHRDLKPGNILATRGDGERFTWKIADFGCAISEKDTGNVGLAGTKEYRSPEMSQGLNYNNKSDVYSLGLVFVEILQQLGASCDKCEAFSGIRKCTGDEERLTRIMEVAEGATPRFVELACKMLDNELKKRPSCEDICTFLKKNKDD